MSLTNTKGATGDQFLFAEDENGGQVQLVALASGLTGRKGADLNKPFLFATDSGGGQVPMFALHPDSAGIAPPIPLGLGIPPKFHALGGQLRALHKSLTNPFEQQVTIAGAGDSILWGTGASAAASNSPRVGTLADPRDNYASSSWMNQLKKYIGAMYFDGTAPTLSNWVDSSAGQSTAMFQRKETLYTAYAPFTVVPTGGGAGGSESKDAAALLGYRHSLAIAGTNTGSTINLSMPNFTGTEFTVVYATIANSGADYELFVDGVSQGTFTTGSLTTVYHQRRTHTFPFVKNKTISMVVKYAAGQSTGNSSIQMEAIEIPKRCTIVNQGIVGATSLSYAANCFGGVGTSMLTADLQYVFLQIGTNDRINTSPAHNQANAINTFTLNLKALIAKFTAASVNVILMNANPVMDESTATYSFSMQDVRNVVHRTAVDLTLDMVDNYLPFNGLDKTTVLADGLHPNDIGHTLYANNIVGAMEMA